MDVSDQVALEAQHSTIALTVEILKASLEESQQIGKSFLHKGYYSYQESRRVLEIARLLREGGLTW